MKKLTAMFMSMCIVSAFAQFTPSTLSAFKEKMLKQKEYAGIIVRDTVKQINAYNFIGDIHGSSDHWIVEFAGDTIKSCYQYVANNDYVRLYMNINSTTGQVISLRRNSSGTIYWWSETWEPKGVSKESCRAKKTKSAKRPMNAQEKKCVQMFGTIVEIATGTFCTTNAEVDSILYKCFAKKDFAHNAKFGEWKSNMFNDIFGYDFSKEGVKEGKEGSYTISINLLTKKTQETFTYYTAKRMIEEKTENGWTVTSNPKFDPKKHIIDMPMTGLVSELWKNFN